MSQNIWANIFSKKIKKYENFLWKYWKREKEKMKREKEKKTREKENNSFLGCNHMIFNYVVIGDAVIIIIMVFTLCNILECLYKIIY